MIASERRLTLGDGAGTTVQTWGERGPLVLAVHGMTSSRRSWERLAGHLAGRFRVVAYDQRGHGDSYDVDGPMALDRGIRDLKNVLASLDEPVSVLLGHSWGGAVVVQGGLSVDVPRVAAVDPMIRQVDAQWYDEYLDELRDDFAFHGAERDARTRAAYGDWHSLDVEGKVHAVHRMTTAPIEGLRNDNPPESWDLRPAIANYPKPLLLAMATHGNGINEDETVGEIERHHAPSVEIVKLDGGHNLHRTNFDAFASALDAFLA